MTEFPKVEWTIQIEDADFCGEKIDYKRMVYTVLIPTR